MKRIILTLMLFLFIAHTANAQQSLGGRPYSFDNALNDNIDAAKLVMPRLNVSDLKQKAQQEHNKGEMLPAGQILQANYSLTNSGVWTILPNKDRIWRLKIKVPDAPATSLYYDNFYLPEGSTLFIYNTEKTHLIGAFSAHNNNESKLFATEIIYTDECVLEYYEPADTKQKGSFTITGIANVYNAPEPPAYIHLKDVKSLGSSGSCNVNVNCPEGSSWQDQKRGVARILIKNGTGQGWCSGSLINNVRQDCKNYFLTANHCGAAAPGADKNQWIFYFNYESSGCSNPAAEPSSNTITGCTMRASASNGANSDVTGSDFLLVELNNTIPNTYNVYYPGWDASGTGSNSGVGIHHPAGDIKKISTYTSALTSRRYYSQLPDNSHWQADWVKTITDHGITEGGSSGSPLFNSSGRIVGKLSGGPSGCTETADKKNDYYGKISYDWTTNGTTASQQLRPWLDPDNTGTTVLDGKEACSVCIANVTISSPINTTFKQEVSNYIIGTSSVNASAGQSVLFDAGQYVQLKPGFTATASGSGYFKAYIDGCGGAFITAADKAAAPITENKKQDVTIEPSTDALQVYPNPFTNKLTISYNNIGNDKVSIEVFSMAGVRVAVLQQPKTTTKGNYSIDWDAAHIPSGVYIIVLTTDAGKKIQKVVKL